MGIGHNLILFMTKSCPIKPFKVLVNDSYTSINSLENILEPDVGMPQQDANRYFKQLINGVVSILLSLHENKFQ